MTKREFKRYMKEIGAIRRGLHTWQMPTGHIRNVIGHTYYNKPLKYARTRITLKDNTITVLLSGKNAYPQQKQWATAWNLRLGNWTFSITFQLFDKVKSGRFSAWDKILTTPLNETISLFPLKTTKENTNDPNNT